jgi:hypothetical protein
MPELPIVDSEGKLLSFAPILLQAYAVYPDGGDEFEELLASGIVSEVLLEESPSEDPIPLLLKIVTKNPWIIPALHRGPTPEKILKDALQADIAAWGAGEILLTMLSVSKLYPDLGVHLRMTIEVISEFQKKSKRATSESTLWNSWMRFKSVAHFHAVRQGWMAAPDLPQDPEYFAAWKLGDFANYLACAENYRKLAISGRFLKYKDAWRTPASLVLPAPDIGLGEPTPELLEIFLRYPAP